MGKVRQLFTNVRVILLLIFLLLSIIAIYPAFWNEGVAIRGVARSSAAAEAGIASTPQGAPPTSREVLLTLNNKPIKTLEEYYTFVSELDINRTVQVKTNKGVYRLTTKPRTKEIVLNETVLLTANETILVNKTVNGTLVEVNETVFTTKEVPKKDIVILGVEDIGLKIVPVAKNNLRKGLDLEGGTRVLLEPETIISENDMETLLSNMQERLNVFGLSDVVVRRTKDLSGNQFILVEIAGINEEEVKDLLARQGKFEAKISNQTVFRGGQDITFVCRTADCSGLDPQYGCASTGDGNWACRFRFSISLTPEAAEQHAAITETLTVIPDASGGGNDYLSQQLDMYLDDQLVDALNIGSDLQGRVVTDISITGSGIGPSRELAMSDALTSMKRLQTIIITGSLPVKLNIVKSDTISPALGEEFVKNALFIGLLVIFSVSLVIVIAYRRPIISIPIIITLLSEVILMLGLAALIRWNLDLAAIAGIIIATGTGVDDQIVIIDEIRRGGNVEDLNWADRIKRAFFVIVAAYCVTVVAMIPLLFAGAGLLKGFAFTTIAGVSFGVFITRPAFAVFVETFLKKE